MGESIRESAKKPEVAKEDRTSQVRTSEYSQPINSSVEHIQFLQRTIGNQIVGRLIKSGALQAKLKIGQLGDIYEQEADRVAEQVMRMPEPSIGIARVKTPNIQSLHPECQDDLKSQPLNEESERVQTHRIAEAALGGGVIHREPDDEAERVRKLNEDYEQAVAKSDWPAAAELLNAFNRDDILARLKKLPHGKSAAVYSGATENPKVGPDALVAQLSRPYYLDINFDNERKKGNWSEAAKYLNGFNDTDIAERVAKFGAVERQSLRAGAAVYDRIVKAIDAATAPVTDLEGGGALGTKVISDVILLKQQGANIEAARTAAFQQLKLSVQSDPVAGEDRNAAITKIAAAMAGLTAVAKIAEPEMLSEGKVAHLAIGTYYASFNEPTLVDPSLIAVIRALKLTKKAYDKLYTRLPEELLESLLVRPDILDLGKMQVYEIKSIDSASRAVPEMMEYIELLESFQIPGVSASDFKFYPGSSTNPGTAGFLLNPQGGWIVFCCPVPGAIIYRTILPMENPRAALERLQNELQGTSNMMVGVETVTAFSIALAMSFEELIPLLIEAAKKAGQAIPELAKSWQELPQGTGSLSPTP